MGFDVSIPDGTWVGSEHQAQQWVQHFLKYHKEVGALGLDTETTGLNRNKDTVVVWSLSDGVNRVCLPSKYLQLFKEPILENPEVNFDLTNAKFDAHMLANTGVDISKAGEWHDTMIQSWFLNENNQGRHGLKECIKDHFSRETPSFESVFGKIPRKTKTNPVVQSVGEIIHAAFDNPDRLITAMDYASLDAFNSTALRRHFDSILKSQGLYELFYNFEVPFTKVLWTMERRGITADSGYLKDLQGPMEEEMLRISKEFAKEAGRPINLNSPTDIRWFFIDKLGLKVVKMTKGGSSGVKKPSTDSDALDKWASDGNEWAKLLLKHRGIAKIYGTYVMGLQDWLDLENRIHTTLNQHGTVTGRLSSTDPNLQNIPRPSEDQFKIREAFIAAFKMTLVVADYAQLEMRLMAHFSGDEKMIDAIKNGIDLHCLTVSEMHGISYDEVVAAVKSEKKMKKSSAASEFGELGRPLTEREEELLQMRQDAKATGFGIIYGIGGIKLAATLTAAAEEAAKKKGIKNTRFVTEDEGFALIDKWFKVFPGVKKYIDNTHEFMKINGFVQTITGRFRRFGDVAGMSFKDRSQSERQAVNSIIQGSAADIAKIVMIIAENDEVLAKLGAKLLLQVHDELIWECPDDADTIAKVKTRVKELMEHPFKEDLKVPLPAEVNSGYSWAAAK
jgi:DNA polymerase-1